MSTSILWSQNFLAPPIVSKNMFRIFYDAIENRLLRGSKVSNSSLKKSYRLAKYPTVISIQAKNVMKLACIFS